MKKGSVIVDLAAENGGNCALTVPEAGGRTPRRAHHRLHRSSEPARANREPALRQQPGEPARPTWAAPPTSRSIATMRWCGARSIVHDGEITWPPPRRTDAAPPDRAAATAVGRHPAPPEPAREEPGLGHRAARARGGGAHRPRPGRAAGVPFASHRVRAGVRRRLAGRLERDAGAAHAADERHQRDQRHHRRSAGCCS